MHACMHAYVLPIAVTTTRRPPRYPPPLSFARAGSSQTTDHQSYKACRSQLCRAAGGPGADDVDVPAVPVPGADVIHARGIRATAHGPRMRAHPNPERVVRRRVHAAGCVQWGTYGWPGVRCGRLIWTGPARRPELICTSIRQERSREIVACTRTRWARRPPLPCSTCTPILSWNSRQMR